MPRPRLRSSRAVLVVALAIALGPGRGHAQAGPPTDALKDFFAAVNVVLTDPRTEEQPLERLRAIRRHVDEIFDVREAARLALGRQWSARTPAEQNEFVALFADLLERSFVWRVAGKASVRGGVTVTYARETVDGDTASVDTALAARDGGDLTLRFRMVQRAARWVVRDVVMDGVSTMENYHAQFRRIVRDGSWPELMSQLRAKLGARKPGVQVATAGAGAAPSAAPAPSSVDRPDTDLAHARAIAQDVGAVVTPGLVVPDAPRAPAVPTAVPALGRRAFQAPSTRPATVPPTSRREPTAVVAAVADRVADVGGVRPPARIAALVPPPAEAPRPAPAGPAREHAGPGVWIQVGAYRNVDAAGRVAAQVNGEILVLATSRAGRRGEPLLRVRVGPFPDREHAGARLQEIRALGYRPFLAPD